MPIRPRATVKVRTSTAKEVSVLAWIADACGRVMLIRQKVGRRLWSLPGGKVHTREPIRQALRRELKEEIGVSVANARIIDVFDRPRKGAVAILFQVSLVSAKVKLSEKEIRDYAFARKLPASATPSARYFWKRQQPQVKARRARPCPFD